MINIILCGGSGTRLWPLSRTLLPKQFVKLFDEQSLFQKTLLRNALICDKLLVVSNESQYFLAKDQAHEVLPEEPDFLLESLPKNTAAAIALSCLAVDPEAVVLVTPSDHLIEDQTAYQQAVDEAKKLAQQGYIVTFGITPTFAETGFGYIEFNAQEVVSFKEKPTFETAQRYLEAGNYAWNSGMFCFKAGVLLKELQEYAPDIYQASQKTYQQRVVETSLQRFSQAAMEQIPEQSIDYAVMEQSQLMKVVSVSMGWSDLGSFDSLYDVFKHDSQGNAIVKRGDEPPPVITENSHRNLIMCRNHAIVTIDVDDLIIVETTDAILVSKKGSSQKVKNVVAQLKKQRSELTDVHRLAYRPWGSYEVLLGAEKYKIKRIIVHPGRRLSLQKHYHRSEHWVVVSGTAEVTIGQKISIVRPNESTYIPIGEVHRLENKGKVDLVMIEVQVGEYTGEDDIVRMDDQYGRC